MLTAGLSSELISIDQTTKRGYGSRSTLHRHIRIGELHPCEQGARTLLSDTELDGTARPTTKTVHDRLAEFAKAKAAEAPTLSPDRRAALAALLR